MRTIATFSLLMAIATCAPAPGDLEKQCRNTGSRRLRPTNSSRSWPLSSRRWKSNKRSRRSSCGAERREKMQDWYDRVLSAMEKQTSSTRASAM
jgi:hypothetical protein